MRILVVQDTDWVRRGPHQQHHVFERLVQRGHTVEVVDFPLTWRTDRPRRRVRRGERLEAAGKTSERVRIPVERPGFLALPLLDYATYGRSVRRLLRDRLVAAPPDVVVGHGILADRAAALEAASKGVPYVAHWLDALDQLVRPAWARPLARRLLRSSLRSARRVIVINRRLAQYAETLGAAPDRIRVIPAGLDLKRYGSDARRASVRRQWGIRPDQVCLLYVGWLYSFSGVDEVTESLRLATTLGDKLVLLVVGQGDLAPRLKKLAADPALAGRLLLAGQQPYGRVPDFLAAADACLLPARRNATMEHIVPIKVYEYLAAGRPVYSTKLPGVQEEFPRSAAIRYVDHAEDIVAAIARDGVSPAQTVQKARRIRALVEGHSWSQVVDQFEQELGAAIREGA